MRKLDGQYEEITSHASRQKIKQLFRDLARSARFVMSENVGTDLALRALLVHVCMYVTGTFENIPVSVGRVHLFDDDGTIEMYLTTTAVSTLCLSTMLSIESIAFSILNPMK